MKRFPQSTQGEVGKIRAAIGTRNICTGNICQRLLGGVKKYACNRTSWGLQPRDNTRRQTRRNYGARSDSLSSSIGFLHCVMIAENAVDVPLLCRCRHQDIRRRLAPLQSCHRRARSCARALWFPTGREIQFLRSETGKKLRDDVWPLNNQVQLVVSEPDRHGRRGSIVPRIHCPRGSPKRRGSSHGCVDASGVL